MSDFKAKMHQIHFLLPRPRWASLQLGELTVPPDPCLYLKGLLLRGWRETGEGRKGKGEGRGEVEGRDLAHPKILVWRPL